MEMLTLTGLSCMRIRLELIIIVLQAIWSDLNQNSLCWINLKIGGFI